MDPADREACPRCGETAALATTVCPFCKGSLLADVVLTAPVEDERIRYQLARAIAGLDPPAPDFSTALKALADPQPVLVRGVSRLAAGRFVESLARFGLAGTVEAAGTVASPKAPATYRMAAVAAGLAAAAVAAALLLARNHDTQPVPRGAAQLTAISRARALPWSSARPPLSLKDLSALAAPALVEIRCGDRRFPGFFVERNLVLARSPELAGCSPIKVGIAGGGSLDGAVTSQDARLGLAAIKVAGAGAEPLRLGDATSIHKGDRVVLMGSASGAESLHEVRLGVTPRLFHGLVFLPIERDVYPEAAGGPVLDGQGYVVGVTVPSEETGGEPFFLPINYAYDEAHLAARPPDSDLSRWQDLLAEVTLMEKLRVEPPQASGAASSPEPSPSIQ